MLRLCGAVLCMLTALISAQPASAQFVGDVYFIQPSIAVPSGNSGDLELAIFTGDKPFGATVVTLTFDPARVSIEGITEGINADDKLRLQWVIENGVVRIVAVNANSLQQPFGSVAIAKLRVRATGAPGERIVIRSAVSKALFADRSLVRAGTGFDAEIIIGQPQSAAAGPTILLGNQSPLAERAKRLRPPGSEVRMITRLADGKFGEVRVRTEGSSAIRD